jgi:flagellar basal body-associated protein FliL
MATPPGNKSADGGLEIDKISLANIYSKNGGEPMAGGDAGQPTPPPAAGPPRGDKNSNLALLAFLAVLALLMALTALFKNQDFSITLLPGANKSDAPLETYLRVGPVTTTLANEDIVKFSIDINCKTPELKKQLAGKDSLIRDKIIAVVTEPETETLIAKRDYEAVKAKIKERLGDLPVEDIYFSELLLY